MIGRRKFIAIAGGVAVGWPLAGHAQGTPLPVIGFLAQGTPEGSAALVAAVRRGLEETGLVEGRDFYSEFRWANNVADLLPVLAADLVRRHVAVIVTLANVSAARAVKTATTTIPVVFTLGVDPIQAGLVASLNHPGANVTGISAMNLDLGSKWVGLLHEILPSAKRFAVLVNIAIADSAKSVINATQGGAEALGLRTKLVFSSHEDEIEPAMNGLGGQCQGLLIHPEELFRENVEKLANLAIREKLPAITSFPNFVPAGGLLSYGSNLVDAHHDAGIYVARILKGERPGDLPVQLATKFKFAINLKTAKKIDIELPPTLLARADEVIE
jgi:putative tryptophan/tyrosine transport system substrate-binding protein